MPLPRARRASVLALALLLWPAAAHAEVVPDQLVVRFAPDTSRAEQAGVLADAGAQDARALPLPDTHVVDLPPGSSERQAATDLQARGDVLWAEPNYVVHADLVPNDLTAGLWGLSNTGQSVPQALLGLGYQAQSGVAGVDVDAPAAWNTTTGSSAVRVGVVDTGIASHRDLDANVSSGLSRDFRDHGAVAVDDPRGDADGHGTHVAGTIGAVGDNGTDVTGVTWTTTLVALRALDAGSGTSADVAAAFAYAGDAGIPIVNASLGGPDDSTAIRTAIQSHPSTLYVVAAGNDGANVDTAATYPCAYGYANLICVASIDNDGSRSYYSNYGATAVDLGAPGNGILSTTATYTTALTIDSSWTVSGAGWTYGANWTSDVTPSMSSTLTSPAGTPANLSGRHGCTVQLTLASSVPTNQGAVIVERSVDGGSTWAQIGVRDTPTSTHAFEYALDADNQASVRVRVRLTTGAGSGTVSNGVTLSSLSVRCLAAGASAQTGILSGTSMATPMVAGVAALLLASKPMATVSELRTALLSSATPSASLAGITVTGGRVDAAAALTALAAGIPPVSGGGGGGGGGGASGGVTATPPPVTTPAPITVPTPVTATATPAAAAPTATLLLDGDDLFAGGLLTVRVAVSGRASVHAAATLRWRGGHTTLGAVTRSGLSAGDSVTLRLRTTERGLRAVRRARKAGRRVVVRVVLTVTGSSAASRQVQRSITLPGASAPTGRQ